MNCQECLQENKLLLQTKGYGLGYIGKTYECFRHNKKHHTQSQINHSSSYNYSKKMNLINIERNLKIFKEKT